MASIQIKLDRRRANSKGEYPIKFIVLCNKTNTSISTFISVPETAWIKDGVQRPLKNTYPGSKSINDTIEKHYLLMKHKLFELEGRGKICSMQAIDVKNKH